MEETKSFDDKQELWAHPKSLSGEKVLHQLDYLEYIQFKKTQQTRQIGIASVTNNWKKNSVFFNYHIGKKLLLSHNLDVMHNEKNVSDNMIRILLGVAESKQ